MLTESESTVVRSRLARGNPVANDMIDELTRRENGTYEEWLMGRIADRDETEPRRVI